MPVAIKQLLDSFDPQRTVLFFGAGSSIPSKGPTSEAIIKHLAVRFGLPETGFNLAEPRVLPNKRHRARRLFWPSGRCFTI